MALDGYCETMCGRFALQASPEQVKALFAYQEHPNFPPRANIAPTEPIAIVVREGGQNHFHLMRWGFLPAWVKDPQDFPLIINARTETLAEKPAYRTAIRHRRGLVPADAFYEWKRDGKIKTPFKIMRDDGGLFAMAALWETYADKNGSEIDTAAIITCAPNECAAELHDRMPAIIEPAQFDLWLDHSVAPDEALRLLKPAHGAWRAEPVDPRTPRPERPAKKAATPKPDKPAQGELF